VEYLFDNIPVDAAWCLVHATHVRENETAMLAESGAVAGLCPSTEANLGDGIFPVQQYFRLGGRFGIGSDSHVCLNPAEELRLLEYVQRLLRTERNIMVSDNNTHTGTALWLEAVNGGARACGQSTGGLQTGARADLLVLDKTHPLLRDNSPEYP